MKHEKNYGKATYEGPLTLANPRNGISIIIPKEITDTARISVVSSIHTTVSHQMTQWCQQQQKDCYERHLALTKLCFLQQKVWKSLFTRIIHIESDISCGGDDDNVGNGIKRP